MKHNLLLKEWSLCAARAALISGRRGAVALGLLLLAFVPINATALDDIGFDFSKVFSGPHPQTTNTPWLNVTFQNAGAAKVLLTITTGALAPDEEVVSLFLNLNPVLNPTKLNFVQVSSTGTFAAPTISKRANMFSVADAGKFDLRFDFNTTGRKSERFNGGDSVAYLVSGISTLTAADFGFLSAPTGGFGPYYAAASIDHIQGCTSDGWIAPYDVTSLPQVPEPSVDLLLAVVFVPWMIWAARRARKVPRLQAIPVRSNPAQHRRQVR